MTYYNHHIFKKMIVVFGLLFVGLKIKKFEEENIRNTTNDKPLVNLDQEILVPISYAKKDKLIARYLRRERSMKGVQMTLPRMAFEITNVYYDAERKLNKLHKYVSSVTANTANVNSQYTPVPYDFDVELSIITNRNDDATKIIEQILPRFAPDIKVSTNLIEDNDICMDIPVILNHVYVKDSYEATQEGRVIIWGLNFTMKGYLFREINATKLTTNVITHIGIDYNTLEGTSITPDPLTAQYNDAYGFTETNI